MNPLRHFPNLIFVLGLFISVNSSAQQNVILEADALIHGRDQLPTNDSMADSLFFFNKQNLNLYSGILKSGPREYKRSDRSTHSGSVEPVLGSTGCVSHRTIFAGSGREGLRFFVRFPGGSHSNRPGSRRRLFAGLHSNYRNKPVMVLNPASRYGCGHSERSARVKSGVAEPWL